MKRIWITIPLLVLILSISGCVQGGGGLAGLMGAGTEEKKAPASLLSFTDIKVIPTPPVRADSNFDFTVQLKNLDDRETVRNTNFNLYDWGRCTIEDSPNTNIGNMFPGSTKILKWEIGTPTNEQLGQMTGECPLRFKVNYNFDASTRAETIVASKEKLRQVSRTGESIKVSPTVTKSRGPIKIDVSFESSQPLRENTTVPFDVVVRNTGGGDVNRLNNDNVIINIPNASFDQSWEEDGPCNYPNEGGSSSATESKRLPFIDKKTPPIRCTFEPPDQGTTPLKTYVVKVDINGYTYTIYDEKIVKVEPTFRGG